MDTPTPNPDRPERSDPRRAQAFARAYPELAAVLDEATTGVEPPHVTAFRRAERADSVGGLLVSLLAFAVLLGGHLWLDWGGWSLVALGIAGCALVGSAYETFLHLSGRMVVVERRIGEETRW